MFNKLKESPTQDAKIAPKVQSVLGPTLTFRGGELSSDEDLVIEGTVEGRIAHQSHELTIGKSGRVKADVHARIIIVEGTIEGDLHGDESVHISRTACVKGNVIAPRISIENGATFDGNIKTSPDAAAGPRAVEPAPLAELAGGLGVRARRAQLSDQAETV